MCPWIRVGSAPNRHLKLPRYKIKPLTVYKCKSLILLVLSDLSWSCEFEVILLIGHWQYVLFDELRKLDSLLGIYFKKLQLNLLLEWNLRKDNHQNDKRKDLHDTVVQKRTYLNCLK